MCSLRTACSQGPAGLLQVLAAAFKAAAQPLLRQICAWVFEGRLHLPPGDFFVRAAFPLPTASIHNLPGKPARLCIKCWALCCH